MRDETRSSSISADEERSTRGLVSHASLSDEKRGGTAEDVDDVDDDDGLRTLLSMREASISPLGERESDRDPNGDRDRG